MQKNYQIEIVDRKAVVRQSGYVERRLTFVEIIREISKETSEERRAALREAQTKLDQHLQSLVGEATWVRV